MELHNVFVAPFKPGSPDAICCCTTTLQSPDGCRQLEGLKLVNIRGSRFGEVLSVYLSVYLSVFFSNQYLSALVPVPFVSLRYQYQFLVNMYHTCADVDMSLESTGRVDSHDMI